MIVSINQPAYLPWLGYFHRIAVSDVHIILDHVQFEKNSFINRNKVLAGNKLCWLTVPVKTKGNFGNLAINLLEIDNATDWRKRHWQTILQNYGKTAYFEAHREFFVQLFNTPWEKLSNLCKHLTTYLTSVLGIVTPIQSSSDLAVEGSKDELILNLCREVGATTYLSGALGRNYLREKYFYEAGINVIYQDYRHPIYPQGRAEFTPYLAVIDLIFNCGHRSLEILMKDQAPILT